jgi:hypothetical protein
MDASAPAGLANVLAAPIRAPDEVTLGDGGR